MMPLIRDTWYVPSRTFDSNTCVETRFTDDAVYVRNNLRPDAGTVMFTHDEWRVFVAGVRDGDYDV
jgi:hypothetical protein